MQKSVLLAALATVAFAGQQPNPARAPRLFKDSREMLAIARAQDRHEVTLLIAAEPGRTAAVAERARRAGGDLRYRDDEVGYLRVRLPLERAGELAESAGIESVTLDVTTRDPFRMGAQLSPPQDTIWPPRWSDYPLSHPYSPLRDLDAAEFLVQHPSFDGRGVGIALLDGNFDLLLPEFQTAYTLDGKRIPKIADYLNVSDPRDDADEMPQWVDMHEEVTASGERIAFRGRSFTTPRDGRFRIGLFDERKFNDPSNGAYLDQDVDRDGNPKGDDGVFGVLWDEASNDVWVDTDRDSSFADEKPMTDYAKRGDVGVFGKDDPTTPMRDAIGFAVQTDPRNKFVSINVGIYQHATEIMGSVVGNREPNGRLQGVAPGARLISMYYGVSNAHGMIEGLIAAFKHPLVDLIVLEQSVAIASLPYLPADGRHPISVILQRLITRYQKLVFVPGSNSPGFALVAEDGLAPGAMSVGGYQSQESYRLNLGYVPEGADHLHWGALSHGPSGTGALKPDLLAPSGQMSTDIGYLYRTFEQELRGLYQLPAGYSVDGGTSTATPMAAGATALLLSAAKQSGVPYDAARLKAALVGSARFIPSLAAHEQGNGLLQVAAAYRLLTALANARPVAIVSRAPVQTRLSHLLAPPHEGVGLYEREGWSVGAHGSRTVTLTRTSGPPGALLFQLSWQGNDGTFSGPSSLALPLNQPVGLSLAITVKEPGAHSALLTLDTPTVPGHAYRMLATVVAPLQFGPGHTLSAELSVPRPGDRPVFVLVPAGVSALSFSAAGEDTTVRLTAISPERADLYPCSFTAPASQPCVVANPEPGVWEINAAITFGLRNFDPNRPNPLKSAKLTVSVALAGVAIAADTAAARRSQAEATADLPLRLTNQWAALSVAAAQTALGSAYRTTRTIQQGEQHLYEVMVPRGATSLLARVSDVAPQADLDIYLLDCTAPAPAPAP
ncbi:MAG TPA: S8 family serine peptidase, partial [Gemmatimonadales bacterium]|nr:S8 family serine peptidase [Gemmatimonadales bacterium]